MLSKVFCWALESAYTMMKEMTRIVKVIVYVISLRLTFYRTGTLKLFHRISSGSGALSIFTL